MNAQHHGTILAAQACALVDLFASAFMSCWTLHFELKPEVLLSSTSLTVFSSQPSLEHVSNRFSLKDLSTLYGLFPVYPTWKERCTTDFAASWCTSHHHH